jgi:hypothetical protein
MPENAALEAWLVELHADRLCDVPPGEPFAWDLIRPAARAAFLDRRDRLARAWPRLCCSCGAEFRPGHRTIRRCAACRARPGDRRAP